MSDAEAPDLDAELLALADGDSSDDESPQQPTTAKSPSPSPERDVASTPSTKITHKKTKSRKPKKARNAESEEEGEASSGDDSLDSAPMDESDADVGSPGSEASGPMFPVENKYYSEKDKAEVLAMPEVEREAVLAERAALIERKQQDNVLKRLYAGYKAKGDKKRKAEDELEGDRKSSRQRTLVGGRKVGETNSAMEAYKAQREQKGILAEQRKQDAADRRAGRGRRRDSGDSDVDADGESEVEWDDTKARQPEQPRFEEPADLKDFNHCKVGRMNFAQYCFYPTFEQTVKDCYIRVNIGPDHTGNGVYRMARIAGITESKPYAMEGSNGKKFITRQYIRSLIGKKEREYPFLHCSMSNFEPNELTQYKANLANDNLPLPKKSFLLEKNKQIHAMIDYQFTESELQEKLKRSGVLKQKSDAVERQSLLSKRAEAEARGDDAAFDQYTARLLELEPPKLAFGTSLYDPRHDSAPKGPTQQEKLAQLNRKNRKADIEEARAQEINKRREMNKNRKRAVPGADTPTNKASAPGSGAITPNGSQDAAAATPTASQTQTQTQVGLSEEALLGSQTTSSSTAKKAPAYDWAQFDPLAKMNAAAIGGGVDENGNRKSVFKRKMCDDEILANMDFGVDLDIEAI